MVVAVTGLAWRRHITCFTGPATLARALATVGAVIVGCLAMTTAVVTCFARRRCVAIIPCPELTIFCLQARAFTTISSVQVLRCAVTRTFDFGSTWWWDGTVLASVRICAAAHAAICFVKVSGQAMTTAVLICIAGRRHRTVNTGVLGEARTLAAICLVLVTCCAVRTAVFGGATRGRHFTILASEPSMAVAVAIVGFVHVIGSAMPRAVCGCHTGWRNGAIFSGPTVRCVCLSTLALTTICAVLVLCGSMPRTVFGSDTHWWNATVRSSPTIMAVAQAAIRLVWVLRVTMVVAINFGARWWGLAVFACVPTITLALAAVHTVHVRSLAMTRTVELLLARRWSAAIVTAVELTIRSLHASAFAPICLVQILGGAMPAAIIASIAWWRHCAVFTRPSFGECTRNHHSCLCPL
jgi:hypothetical protein